VYDWFLFDSSTFAASSLTPVFVQPGSTKAPRHRALAVRDGVAWLLYQSGSGLRAQYSVSPYASWSEPLTISSNSSDVGSLVIDANGNVHIVYGRYGLPSGSGDEPVYYRPLIRVASGWLVGSVQYLAGGGFIWDADESSRTSPVLATFPDGKLLLTYIRSQFGLVTLSAIRSLFPYSWGDAYSILSCAVSVDDESRVALDVDQGNIVWGILNTGSTYSLIAASNTETFDFFVVDSWLGDNVDQFSILVHNRTIYSVFLRGGRPYLRTFDQDEGDIEEYLVDSIPSQSVSISLNTKEGVPFVFWSTSGGEIKAARVDNLSSPIVLVSGGNSPSDLALPKQIPDLLLAWTDNGGVYTLSTSAPADAYKKVTDSGSGSESVLRNVVRLATDSATRTESVKVVLYVFDDGTFQDSVPRKSMRISESVTSSDSSRGPVIRTSDAGTGSDSRQLTVFRFSSDSSVSSEFYSLSMSIADSGVYGEAIGDSAITIRDDRGGSEEFRLTPTAPEVLTGSDSWKLSLSSLESSSALDNVVFIPKIQENLVASDQFSASSAGAVEAAVSGDSVFLYPRAIENANGTDDCFVVQLVTPMFVRLVVTSGRIRLKVES